MAKEERVRQVNKLLQGVLGEELLREDMPEGMVATVTRVESASSLQHATVYISVIPEAKEADVLRHLERNVYRIQQDLNTKLSMRPVPKIRWQLDRRGSNAQRIDELLDQIKEEE